MIVQPELGMGCRELDTFPVASCPEFALGSWSWEGFAGGRCGLIPNLGLSRHLTRGQRGASVNLPLQDLVCLPAELGNSSFSPIFAWLVLKSCVLSSLSQLDRKTLR